MPISLIQAKILNNVEQFEIKLILTCLHISICSLVVLIIDYYCPHGNFCQSIVPVPIWTKSDC